jgi:hypothetical protein
MKVIGFIEDREIVKKILKHLGISLAKKKPPPQAHPPAIDIHSNYPDPQVPSSEH